VLSWNGKCDHLETVALLKTSEVLNEPSTTTLETFGRMKDNLVITKNVEEVEGHRRIEKNIKVCIQEVNVAGGRAGGRNNYRPGRRD